MVDIHIDIEKLAGLSRIAITEPEKVQLEKELPEILAFVEQVNEAGGEVQKETGKHYNIFREDTDPHESGVYTDILVEAMPKKTDDKYLKVRKIIQQD